jgi:hypothetical protein
MTTQTAIDAEIQRLDGRLATLEAERGQVTQARAALVRAADLLDASQRRAPAQGKRAKPSASDQVVLSAMRDGHDKLAAIAKAGKLKESAARLKVLALIDAGWVRRVGAGRSTRYVVHE